jgi:hypothetical protein
VEFAWFDSRRTRFDLRPHPDSHPDGVRAVSVELGRPTANLLFLAYSVTPAATLRLSDHDRPGRQDELWRSTCFELFARWEDGSYCEYNFAPMSAWNAYAFSDWRTGMTPIEMAEPPHLVDSRLDDRSSSYPGQYELDVIVSVEAFATAVSLSLTAIIEEKDGTKSYWAMAHPPGPPNFHDPACFMIKLPPAPAPPSPRT